MLKTNINNNEIINELPIRKKKGRKSKQTKILELEEIEKNKIPLKLFPTLKEKIFDVIKIDKDEYYLDVDFGIIYNSDINQIGIKNNGKYILYSDYSSDNLIKQIQLENKMIKQINDFLLKN